MGRGNWEKVCSIPCQIERTEVEEDMGLMEQTREILKKRKVRMTRRKKSISITIKYPLSELLEL